MKIFKSDLDSVEFAGYFENYINKVSDLDLLEGLQKSYSDFEDVVNEISIQGKQLFKYDPIKWTIQDLILHMIDAERVFCYRALCISRNDKTHFPGFDENLYVDFAEANKRTFESLVLEFKKVRENSVLLFENFSENQFKKIGHASKNEISVRAIGFIISGHTLHHIDIIKNRYLN